MPRHVRADLVGRLVVLAGSIRSVNDTNEREPVYRSAVPAAGGAPFEGVLPQHAELRTDDLGPGWEQASQALHDLQADLSRTVPDAPMLMLLWYQTSEGGRHAYVGKAVDWYFGASGGFDLSPRYVEAVIDLAEELRGAIQDNLLGYLSDWPLCPDDGWPLTVSVNAHQTCLWVCDHGEHSLGKVGQLRAAA